jgi:hypothetical protein
VDDGGEIYNFESLNNNTGQPRRTPRRVGSDVGDVVGDVRVGRASACSLCAPPELGEESNSSLAQTH